ncbi:hypothetical protein [Saccharomonospora iraqiensis]|uniref:hypothetical protein n=1 Tax=Saccharomonospora iraqiensis TaxID=52698 RepID=UPI0003FB0631|nr:hypothetical protein [Saccharomonospora iraqiensis]
MSTPTTALPAPPLAPAQRDLPAALLRIARAVEAETEALYRRKDAGYTDTGPALRALAFRVLELGFTVAEEGGLDCREVEAAVARVYELPDYGAHDPRRTLPGTVG